MGRKTVLSPWAKSANAKELLEKLILALADHPQVSYYLWKHGFILEKESK